MMQKGKTVAVIGGGGREAALVHKYSQSPQVKCILAIPGNDLMQINSKIPVLTFKNIRTTDIFKIINVCKKYKVDLVDVAQDDAVEAGLVNKLTREGFLVCGPTQKAGQIEWDKAWSRDFMKKYSLPIPLYKVFNSKSEAIRFVKENPSKRWFVKASGLAAGKGVIPAQNLEEALSAIKQMSEFGKAGKTFVIEEWLDGEEFSMFAISDGMNFKILGSAQDHKRLFDKDIGPNTGGMGCSTPPLIITKNIYKQAKIIIKKTFEGLKKEGRPYKGILYFGGIVVKEKVFVIEFNARWGDPEAEALLPGIKNDLHELSLSVTNQALDKIKIQIDGFSRVAITGSLRPGVVPKKRELFGVEKILKLKDVIFYGTRVTKNGQNYYASSGRLFHVVGAGKTVIEARQKAYEAMSLLSIEGDNLHYRTDIGYRDVARLHKS